MKYPLINKKELDNINKQKFVVMKRVISSQIEFDNGQNEFGLTRKDIELLSWNAATRLITIV